jgi:flagellum-specific ATP synthase
MKSLLDGHIVLSRSLAEEGQYPAIDVCRSVSRQSERLMTPQHHHHATQVLDWISHYQSSRTLVNTGLYAKGSNHRVDRALEKYPDVVQFLKQRREERVTLDQTLPALALLAQEGGRNAA